jgi:hypothetical protein
MKIALYIGNHKGDPWHVRAGWWITRFVQRGEFKDVTHVEAILREYDDGTVDIASSTLRKEYQGHDGVRVKRCKLRKGNWQIFDVQQFDEGKAGQWFAWNIGRRYDQFGAVSCVFLGGGDSDRWYCNEAVGASFGLKEPHRFSPSRFALFVASLGVDVTADFFQSDGT